MPYTKQLHFTHFFIIGEGNGNLLQYSCLENPRDKAAWLVTTEVTKQQQHTNFTLPRIAAGSHQNIRYLLYNK